MTEHAGYEWFIDELVQVANGGVTARRIRSNGHSVRTTDDEDFPLDREEREEKELLLSLDPRQREVIARMIEEARRSAIHDLASFFDGHAFDGKVSVRVDGKALGESPYASYHYDFICRLEGDDWPDDD